MDKKREYENFIKDLEEIKREYADYKDVVSANDMMNEIYDLSTTKYENIYSNKIRYMFNNMAIFDIDDFKNEILKVYQNQGISTLEEYIENITYNDADWFVSKCTFMPTIEEPIDIFLLQNRKLQLFDLDMKIMHDYVDLEISNLKETLEEHIKEENKKTIVM